MPQLSLNNLLPKKPRSFFSKLLITLVDYLLGISQLNRVYQDSGLKGLEKKAFATRFVNVFELTVKSQTNLPQLIPPKGAAIVVANHPYGGIEGVILAFLLSSVRGDVKILANQALKIIPELADFFIFTNPLVPGAKGNAKSLRACKDHLAQGGLLVLFPAGRVSYPGRDGQVTDHQWHRIVGALTSFTQAPLIPCFISGKNSDFFYFMGKIYFRFRMLLLIREMLNSKGRTVEVTFGQATLLPSLPEKTQMTTDIARLMTYLHAPEYQHQWPVCKAPEMLPLAASQLPHNLDNEISQLPQDQCLLQYKYFKVYYASRAQCPAVIEDIRRLREENFRQFDEGSGLPQDGDAFDDTYTHLFVYDTQNQAITGAYRMGQTDNLLAQGGVSQLYLNRMFDFSAEFINQQQPCLEMGRSFVVASHQRSFHGLLLLFKGIGAFVCKFPQYRTLYGTVSLSKQYTPMSVRLIEQFLVTSSSDVKPKKQFDVDVPNDIKQYLASYPADIEILELLVKQIEPDGKGLPVLVKLYHQLGAKFYCVGIDPNFAETPGLLLSVDLPHAPERLLKLYLGQGAEAYLQHNVHTSQAQ
jgi:putative hemolysin